MCSVTAWHHSRLRAHWLMGGDGGLGWGRSMYSALQGNCSVSYLSFVYGKSLWAELNGGENNYSLHWKANMLPLFSIMTLWFLLCCSMPLMWLWIFCPLLLSTPWSKQKHDCNWAESTIIKTVVCLYIYIYYNKDRRVFIYFVSRFQ